jgi:hypothetical protein
MRALRFIDRVLEDSVVQVAIELTALLRPELDGAELAEFLQQSGWSEADVVQFFLNRYREAS